MQPEHQRLLLDLLSLPTSPFNEQYLAEYVRRWAAARPMIRLARDDTGNLQLRLRRGPSRGSPLLLVAHMDHPGFEAERMLGANCLRARWRGGVPPEYFKGAAVRFFADGRWIRGRIQDVKVREETGRRRVSTATVAVRENVPRGAVGMWDLPDAHVRGSRLYARGCDDVAGVAAILMAFDVLAGHRCAADLSALLTRAEEVGFAGAIAACRRGSIPREALVISVECSSQDAGGRMGEGPILRVGDLASVFTPDLTAFCRAVATDLAKSDRAFKFQRKLMDGGTCEASVFCNYGYAATGVCVALGNYHNVDSRRTSGRQRIAPEYVDVRDLDGLVRWFVALAAARREHLEGNPRLRTMLTRLERRWMPLLNRTARRIQSSVGFTS